MTTSYIKKLIAQGEGVSVEDYGKGKRFLTGKDF